MGVGAGAEEGPASDGPACWEVQKVWDRAQQPCAEAQLSAWQSLPACWCADCCDSAGVRWDAVHNLGTGILDRVAWPVHPLIFDSMGMHACTHHRAGAQAFPMPLPENSPNRLLMPVLQKDMTSSPLLRIAGLGLRAPVIAVSPSGWLA